MKRVLIEIPDEFENDLEDKFNDFFGRVKADLGDCSEALLCGNYEMKTIDMFLKSFDSAKDLSGMTNGDVIKTIYPDVIISESEDTVHLKYPTVNSDPLFFVQISKKRWNAPYKAESER